MALTFSRLSARAVALSFLAVAGIGVAAGGAGTSSEAMLKSSFSAAIASDPSAYRVAKSLPVAGSEEFWLSAMRSDSPAGLSKAVSIGDRIAMTLDGTSRQLKVEAVAEITPDITEIDTASERLRLVLVTARDMGDAASKPVRFIMQIPAADVPARVQSARAL